MKQKTYWKSLKLQGDKIVSDYDKSEWKRKNEKNFCA